MESENFRVDVVENAVDSIERCASFIEEDDSMKWKWVAISAHHALYSFCIAALHNSSPSDVTSSAWNPDDDAYCKRGDQPWMVSRKVKIGNGPAYRIEWDLADSPPEVDRSENDRDKPATEGRLIGFWTALARVQDDYHWMNRFSHTEALSLADDEMKDLEWLTNEVRNNLAHFIPKLQLISVESVRETVAIAVKAIEFLALDSISIFHRNGEWKERVRSATETILTNIDA